MHTSELLQAMPSRLCLQMEQTAAFAGALRELISPCILPIRHLLYRQAGQNQPKAIQMAIEQALPGGCTACRRGSAAM